MGYSLEVLGVSKSINNVQRNRGSFFSNNDKVIFIQYMVKHQYIRYILNIIIDNRKYTI